MRLVKGMVTRGVCEMGVAATKRGRTAMMVASEKCILSRLAELKGNVIVEIRKGEEESFKAAKDGPER